MADVSTRWPPESEWPMLSVTPLPSLTEMPLVWLTALAVLADETVWAVPCPSLTPTLWPHESVSPSLTPWLTPSLTLWAVESERPLAYLQPNWPTPWSRARPN